MTLDLRSLYDCIDDYFDKNRPNFSRHNLASLKFDQLESFKLITDRRKFLDEQIDLLLSNKDLISVDFSSYQLTYKQMLRLVDGLPKLKELTLKFYTNKLNDLEHLMEKCIELDTINVVVVSGDAQIALLQRTSWPGNWKLHSHQSGQEKSLTYRNEAV